MNGLDFFNKLEAKYKETGQPIYGNYLFNGWVKKRGEVYFGFMSKSGTKHFIEKEALIKAWDANTKIDDWWARAQGFRSFNNSPKLHVLKFLLSNERQDDSFKNRAGRLE